MSVSSQVPTYKYFAGGSWREATGTRYFDDHAPMGGVRDSGWGRTGPDSLADFSDVIWINSRGTERHYPF